MRMHISCALAALLIVAAPIFAQPLASPGLQNLPSIADSAPPPAAGAKDPPPTTTTVRTDTAFPAPALHEVQPDAIRFWANAEYLAFWVKNTPQPVSILVGDPTAPSGQFLGNDRDLGTFSGFRLTVGAWLNDCGDLGVESSFFVLAQRSHNFTASSDAGGFPGLAFPFQNQTPGAVGFFAMPITMPGLFAGSISVTSTLQLWGAEANGVMSLVRSGGFEWTGLVGFRYADLYETLNISSNSADIVTDPPTVLLQRDQFNTRNQFAGAQLGSRFTWMGDRFGFDVTGKVALGATHQSVKIQGSSTQTGPGGVNGTFPGGFFTQPSNLGSFSANQFAVIPSVEMKLYILLSQRMRLFAGYDFMYWSSVVRPGSQIDRNINLSQSAVFGSGTLSGPASPAPLFNRTDFWAQGVSFGIEVRY